MRIAFFTLPRTPEYLTATLGRLAAQYPPVVFDRNVALYYDAVEPPPLAWRLAEVQTAAPERLAALQGHPLAATYNYIRALDWLARGSAVGLACEDDLEFAEQLCARVGALGALAECVVGPRWLLTLHHFYPLGSFDIQGQTSVGDHLLQWRNVDGFYASQAMAMPAGVAAELRDGFARHAGPLGSPVPEDWATWKMDMGIKNLCRELALPLFTVHPCLIQHVGDVSVACPGRPPLRNAHYRARL